MHLSQRSPQHGRGLRGCARCSAALREDFRCSATLREDVGYLAALREGCPGVRACSAALPREVCDRFVFAFAFFRCFCFFLPGCSSSDLLRLHVEETHFPFHGGRFVSLLCSTAQLHRSLEATMACARGLSSSDNGHDSHGKC